MLSFSTGQRESLKNRSCPRIVILGADQKDHGLWGWECRQQCFRGWKLKNRTSVIHYSLGVFFNYSLLVPLVISTSSCWSLIVHNSLFVFPDFPNLIHFCWASAPTKPPSAEFVCLRVPIARSSGRSWALAAPGGGRNGYEFTCRPSCFISVCCHLCPIFANFEKIVYCFITSLWDTELSCHSFSANTECRPYKFVQIGRKYGFKPIAISFLLLLFEIFLKASCFAHGSQYLSAWRVGAGCTTSHFRSLARFEFIVRVAQLNLEACF